MRSRLLRLAPSDAGPETQAIGRLFNHRLPKSPVAARVEWFDIIESTHALWEGISSPKRELIRSYLNSFNLEAVKRIRPSSRFDYSGSSVGNLFLTGARLFTGSFEAAVYLLGTICGVPDRIAVLPAINTNFAHHIAAGLADGTVIVGQNDISHPSQPTRAVPGIGIATATGGTQTPATTTDGQDATAGPAVVDTEEHDHVEDANLPGSLPALRRPAIAFSKTDEEDLPSRIDRIWYINPYGQEIRIPASPRVIDALRSATTVVYSIGSLFTSLVPNLVLKGVGDAVAGPLSSVTHKILVLNGTTDRETGPSHAPFTGLDFVAAIVDACAYSRGLPRPRDPSEYAQYVSHVIYMDSPAAPRVDRQQLAQMGIETVRVYGARSESDGRASSRYDARALQQALESIVGRRDGNPSRSRRNTLVG